jgi:hypothetical protein
MKVQSVPQNELALKIPQTNLALQIFRDSAIATGLFVLVIILL